MAVAADEKRHETLIDGRMMRCPRCRENHDVLRYVPMGIVEEFAHETNPIYKCPNCRWVFSPALSIAELQTMLNVQIPDERGKPDD